VQTCSKCDTQAPDSALICPTCQAELKLYSRTSVALKKLLDNPRVNSVRLVVGVEACPACQEVEGTYLKAKAPRLPVEGCSCGLGCRCFYEPVLEEIYP
jgi:hypothetical protein